MPSRDSCHEWTHRAVFRGEGTPSWTFTHEFKRCHKTQRYVRKRLENICMYKVMIAFEVAREPRFDPIHPGSTDVLYRPCLSKRSAAAPRKKKVNVHEAIRVLSSDRGDPLPFTLYPLPLWTVRDNDFKVTVRSKGILIINRYALGWMTALL